MSSEAKPTGEIKAPAYPESVDDGTVIKWHKSAGDAIQRDELLVEIETDKVVMEVVAPSDGVLVEIVIGEGEVAAGEQLLGTFSEETAAVSGASSESSDSTDVIEIKAPVFPESVDAGTIAAWHKQPGDAIKRDENLVDIETDKVVLEVVAPADGTLSQILKQVGEEVAGEEVVGTLGGAVVAAEPKAAPVDAPPAQTDDSDDRVAPAARVLLKENNLSASDVTGTGKGGLVTKEDVVNHLQKNNRLKPHPKRLHSNRMLPGGLKNVCQ